MALHGRSQLIERIYANRPNVFEMLNLALYVLVVLVWGSSWLAIKYQIGVVAPEASLVYRFVISAAVMFAWVLMLRLPLRFTLRDHGFIALQGALIFCLNYFLFYHAAAYLTTGLIAVVMSTASIVTMLISIVVLGRRPSLRMLAGAALGTGGIAMVFWPDLVAFARGDGSVTGLLLSAGGMTSFAIGSMVAARNQASGLSVRGSSAWAMAYGVMLMATYSLARGTEFTFDYTWLYSRSLLYLSIFSTVIAFALYFALLGRIGPERSAYTTVLFPVVALTLSTFFEGYEWTSAALIGVALTLVGNLLVLLPDPVRTPAVNRA